MKKFILLIAIIAFFICPSICFSSYLIELKNGSAFIINHYWEEVSQVKFYYYGGVVGISKNLIRKIEKTDLVYEEKTVSPQKKPETTPVTKQDAVAKTEETPAVSAANKKDDLFIKEFNALKERFENIQSMTTKELYDFSKELTGFRDKIHKSRLGRVYANQIFENHAMGVEVETVIRSRDQ
ncbi:MAG: hypothetical protein U9N47_04815 [Thermodesulfobacteriota bacterium]|nr:hypothetical protein [Thermodesulfobacteriota bacterium]